MNLRGRHDVLCFSRESTCSWGQFAADVAAFRADIAKASHVCNLLADRYEFMVGLAAAMLNDQITVLPSATATEAIAAALAATARPLVLGGPVAARSAEVRINGFSSGSLTADPAATLSALERSDAEVHVYTSGSTKQPIRHRKSWAALAGGAGVTEKILRGLGLRPGSCAILGTTPHQHMYSLEATIFLGLSFGHCIYRGTIFYPADLERAVAEAGQAGFGRLVLVTSPAHLKFLEPVILAAPEISAVISATAPLSRAQAARLEARGDLPVMEIYGSTETGSLATRRTVESEDWEVLEGVVLDQQPDGCVASAPHLQESTPLGDAIELASDGRFRLLGRLGEMVSVAGKRTDLAALNAILMETDGILDGVVIRRRTESDDILAVVAVRDSTCRLSETDAKAAIRKQFRLHVDGIFVPKRIRFVDRLPRSGTGKISAREIEAMLRLLGLGH